MLRFTHATDIGRLGSDQKEERKKANNQRTIKAKVINELLNFNRETKKNEKTTKSKNSNEKVYLIKETKKVKFESSD